MKCVLGCDHSIVSRTHTDTLRLSQITSIENQLEGLQQLLQSLHSERERLANSLTGPAAHSVSTRQVAAVGLGASGHAGSGISYTAGSFEWSVELLQTAKVVFGIVAFRLCQEGCA